MAARRRRAPDPHDHLVRYVFCSPDAIAVILRRALPAELLACLDLRSLRHVPTVLVNPRLRTRVPDLCFRVYAVDGTRRVLVYVVIEHQSTRDSRMPWRALVCSGDLWDRYIRVHPGRRRGLPFILPLLLTQHPARNTPVQLSGILDVPPRLRRLLGTPIQVDLHVDDFSGSILGDRKAPPATRALVELARALLHAYKNPRSVTRHRVAELAQQVDVLLKHKRPDDVAALWVYVISVFEASSPLRAMLVKSISQPAREMYMTIEEELLARGQRIGKKIGEAKGEVRGRALGKAEGKAEAVLGVLEHREVPVSAAVRERVLAARDELELQQWFERAFTVASAEALFRSRQGPSRGRSSTIGVRSGRARGGRRLVAA
jgi:predicted transposase YdaD